MKQQFFRGLSSLLIIALLALCVGFALPQQRQEPKNPIPQAPENNIQRSLPGAARDVKKQPDETKESEMQTEPESEPLSDTHGVAQESDGNPNSNGKDPEDAEDSDPKIVTDLSNRILTRSALENDMLSFYAYIDGGSSELYLRVSLRNEASGDAPVYLQAEGKNYQAKLSPGANYFNLFIKDGSQTVARASFVLTYEESKADADTPTVGANPPEIVTNLDGWTEKIKTERFLLRVRACDAHRMPIYASHVLVQLDGKTVRNPTGAETLEYALYFPTAQEDTVHTVTVLAWDEEGNSRFVSYTVTYQSVGEGEINGKIRIVMDASTLELGWIFDVSTDIRQGQTLAHAVLQAFENEGFTASYTGTPELNFYLRRVYGGDVAGNAHIPDALLQKLQTDGVSLTGQSDRDSLGEQDYTKGSGWMYSINGSYYPGISMSEYMPTDGDTVYLRFTLAYGKDIGGSSDYGTLRSYCGSWVNGGYLEAHSYDAGAVLQEATCTEPELFAYTCQVEGCGHQKTELRGEALGHEEYETARVEPTESTDGYIEYTCTRCGAVRQEPLPMTGTPTQPTEEEQAGRKQTEDDV